VAATQKLRNRGKVKSFNRPGSYHSAEDCPFTAGGLSENALTNPENRAIRGLVSIEKKENSPSKHAEYCNRKAPGTKQKDLSYDSEKANTAINTSEGQDEEEKNGGSGASIACALPSTKPNHRSDSRSERGEGNTAKRQYPPSPFRLFPLRQGR